MGFKIPNFSQQMSGSPFQNKAKPANYNKHAMNTILNQYDGRYDTFRGARTSLINPNSASSQAMRDAYKADWGTDFDPQSEDSISYANSYYASKKDAYDNLKETNPNMSRSELFAEAERLRGTAFGQGDAHTNELQDLQNTADVSRNPYSGFGSDAWNNNFTIKNGKRVDKYGNSYEDNQAGFMAFQEAAKAYNADKAGDTVINPDNVEPLEVAVNPNEHTPSEGINILSNKQIRAAKRVSRLRNKASKRGGLTEGQSKRLNRNIDKAQGDEVAYGDRTKVGQFLKGKPVDPSAFTKENMDPYGDEDPFDV